MRFTATTRSSASNSAMPWRMLSSIACWTTARAEASRCARNCSVMSVCVTTKPPSGVGSDETSSMRPFASAR